MVDDVNLEKEESQECEEERNKISAGYLSKKITDLAHMEEFMRGAIESYLGLVNQVMPLTKKLCQHLSDLYQQKIYVSRLVTVIVNIYLHYDRVYRYYRIEQLFALQSCI